jgi:hypothetical protein
MNADKFSEWFLSANRILNEYNNPMEYKYLMKIVKEGFNDIMKNVDADKIIRDPSVHDYLQSGFDFALKKGALFDIHKNIFAVKDKSYIHSKSLRDKFEEFVDKQWELLNETRNKKIEKEKDKKAKDKEFESTRIGVKLKITKKTKVLKPKREMIGPAGKSYIVPAKTEKTITQVYVPATLKVKEKKFLSSTLPKIPTDIMDNIFSFLEPPKPTKISF